MCCVGRPSVTLNGNKVSGWAFDQNNVLSFEMQAGFSAWLQFTVLPGGPLFLGTMAPSNTEGFISDKEFQVRSWVIVSSACLTLLLHKSTIYMCIAFRLCPQVSRWLADTFCSINVQAA